MHPAGLWLLEENEVYVKKILSFTLILFTIVLAGCNPRPSAISGPTKSYKVPNGEISFSTPSAPWAEKVITLGEELGTLGAPIPAETALGVTFKRPEKEGLISVGVLGQQKDDKGNLVDLENDQETLNQIALWVEKRDGERLKEEYIQVLGVNAFHMIFEVGDEQHREKGEQVHFTKDGTHYALSIVVPKSDYDAEVGHFRNLVSSFKVEKAAPTE